MKQQADLIIRNITIYTQNAARNIIPNCDIAVKDGKILAIGDLDKNEWSAVTVLDGTGKALFPGMQNMHVHIFQSLFKGIGADLPLMGWINAVPLRVGPYITPELNAIACRLAVMESLKCGVTTLSDFNYLQHTSEIAYSSIETMEEMGIRGIYMDCYHDTGKDFGVNPSFIHPADKCIERTDALVKRYKNDEHPLMDIWAGASVAWGTTEELYRAVSEYSRQTKIPYTMHILETVEDNIYAQKAFGMSLIESLEKFEALSDRLLAVHCVQLTDEEINTFAKYGVNSVYCGTCNAYLGSGTPPMAAMKRAGVNITMGTDGAASNNSSDMIESLKIGLLLQKAYERNPVALTASEMLDFATINASKASHREDVGSLEVGKLADMFIFNPAYARSCPNHDTLATLMYNSSQENIETTIVNGKIAYHKGHFSCGMEERDVVEQAEREVAEFMKLV